MLRYFEILRDCNLIANVVGNHTTKLPKTEGKYMGEKEHLLQAEIYLRQCIKSLEDAHSIYTKSLKK